MKCYVLAVLVVSASNPAPAPAQNAPVAISVKSGQPFRHKHTKLGFPPAIGTLVRDKVADGEPDQYDVSVNYAAPGDAEALTIYVYRHASGALPVWFDRAQWAIENRDIYGRATAAQLPPAFVPPGQRQASALSASYALDDSPYRSTAVALLPLDDWYVKVRLSSKTLTAPALDERLKSLIEALDWPTAAAAPPAIPVADCPDTIITSAWSADINDTDVGLQAGMVSGITANAIRNRASDAKGTPATWCRDATQVPLGGVYRANASRDAYLLALTDAGRGVQIQPSMAQAMLKAAGKPGAGPPAWSVDFMHLTRVASFRPQDALPAPERVLAMLKTQPLLTTSTDRPKPQVSINAAAVSQRD